MIGPLNGFQKRLSNGVFPSDKRSWIFRRQEKHSMESAYHFSPRPDGNNTADVPSFTLRTAPSAISFVSDLCGIDAQRFQERSSQALPNAKDLSVYMTFEFPIWLQELLQALRSFCFARIRLDPLGGQVLHHDCISVIVSRFTPFTENFVIGCNQITKIFCTRYDSANTSSAQGPCNFGPLADLALSVFREVSFTLCLPKSTLVIGSKDNPCVGCDIVQADHAPEAGVAQGIFHGILVRHHGRIQEEVEEGLENKVEKHEEGDTQEQVRMPMTMDGNEDTQTRLEPHVTMYA